MTAPWIRLSICGVLATLGSGCATESPLPPPGEMEPVAAAPAPPAATAAPAPAAATHQAPAPLPAAAPVAAAPSPPSVPVALPVEAIPQQKVEMETKPAQAGVGVKGQTLRQELGTTAVKTYFLAKERTVFNMQLPSALSLYKAEQGRGPQSHDEFMQRIVQANQIELPQLPAGERYLWDPEKQELFVEHPQR